MSGFSSDLIATTDALKCDHRGENGFVVSERFGKVTQTKPLMCPTSSGFFLTGQSPRVRPRELARLIALID